MNIEAPFTLWLMGPTSSGKTTIASVFAQRLMSQSISILHYDGDEIRDLFGDGLGFQQEDRMRVVKTLAYFANKSVKAGVNVVVSALTAHQDARDYIYGNVTNLIICYVRCDIDVCAQRDPKGLYKKAKNGQIDTLIGYNTLYREPNNPDLIIDTQIFTPKDATDKIMEFLVKSKKISL